ncbi:MAG: hypothetical protein ACNS63_01625 [Candidatus Nitrospinota bacterium M3_3B_026]
MKDRYVQDVRTWAMLVLQTLRDLPDTAEKLTLLRQVDKVKDASRITSHDLPAYAGALAVLSSKAARLRKGMGMDSGYSREQIAALVRSEILRGALMANPESFSYIRSILDVKRKEALSETLLRLSKSGH